jgi:hypothetical protein
MADIRQTSTAGSQIRFVMRFLGWTGLFAALGSLTYLFFLNGDPIGSITSAVRASNFDEVTLVALVGATLAAAWIAIEFIMSLVLLTGQRVSASGNVYTQIVLAVALLVMTNAASFVSYRRFDCTRNSQFTLAPELVKELQTLRDDSPTDVVVLQLHKSAISRGLKRDNIDRAAETKIVEKVNDLVDELRELGPRFNVTVLDIEDDYFADQVDTLTSTIQDRLGGDAGKIAAKDLRNALDGAPEDSIFFHSNGKLRRMGFAEFYRLDKTASLRKDTVIRPDGLEEDRFRSNNLVLLPQGRDRFVKKLLGIEERKPRIGLVAIHKELSSQEESEELTAAGMRKSLEANGFEVVDVLVKKWGRGGPTPAALTYDEYEYDRLEANFNLYSVLVQDRQLAMQQFTEFGKLALSLPLAELDRRFRRAVGRSISTESDRQLLINTLNSNIELRRTELVEFQRELAEVEPKLRKAEVDERAGEGRRVSDIAAKLKTIVAECDLLIVPRLTSVDLAKGFVIRPTFYALSKEQADVIKEYLKAGKPVMALFGSNKFGQGMDAEPDDVEKLFTRFGIVFGNQTVVTDKEAKAAKERQGDGLASGSAIPPLVFDVSSPDAKSKNPITTAFQTANRAVAGKLAVNKSGPRPITLNPIMTAKLAYAGTILETIKESWNEERAIADDDYVPSFDTTKLDDPKKGTPDEERRGPFSIGVALETPIPAEWIDEKLAGVQGSSAIAAAAGGLGLAASTLMLDASVFAEPGTLKDRPTVRIAAYGHGGLFTGNELSPGQEQLLLATVNWQLRRDDRLPQDPAVAGPWSFPRLSVSPGVAALWRTVIGFVLPAACLYFGILALSARRFR